ncbi:late embryogenesis abundant protein group 8 protein [Tripterygium wilfordii]|uniref:Late embryogenesis abundant protein group 8 protein n=1 Tax=Tripterygium wilfordii TaxID=458696 RepID=A0A7J7CQ22_TRIWF|nr:uncharacterized protein LOC120014900 [Tripterygium wilfordii]KAF5736205.1 late embryogenesis abundant protein group 8 protein [Tripterygium wilfordii]
MQYYSSMNVLLTALILINKEFMLPHRNRSHVLRLESNSCHVELMVTDDEHVIYDVAQKQVKIKYHIIKPCKTDRFIKQSPEDEKWQQMEKKQDSGGEEKKGSLEGLPVVDSPYVKYKDVDDYKRKGYGTEGHQEPKPRGGGSTDAPTPSGTGTAVSSQSDVAPTDVINHQGVP